MCDAKKIIQYQLFRIEKINLLFISENDYAKKSKQISNYQSRDIQKQTIKRNEQIKT